MICVIERDDDLMVFFFVYSILTILVLSLNHFDVISNAVATSLYVAMGFFTLIIAFLRLASLKVNAGELIVVLKKDLVSQGILMVTIFTSYSWIIYMSILMNKRSGYTSYSIICLYFFSGLYVIIMSLFSKNIISKKGIMFEETLISWEKIESYEWVKRTFQIRKGFTILLINRKTKIFSGKKLLKIDKTQMDEVDLLLRKNLA